jgi:predicted metal-dependent HD superfamily phosphohydrolase
MCPIKLITMTMHRFTKLWEQLDAITDTVKVYKGLFHRYSEPHRFYHTHKHIEHCLMELNDLIKISKIPYEVEAAIWFHDSIYDPKRVDNEERSASFTVNILKDAAVSKDIVTRVNNMILETKHDNKPEDIDSQLFLDIDLSILGAEKAEFDFYEEGIRREYYFIPNPLYIRRRTLFLTSILTRDKIYNTSFFNEKYEENARENIIQLIKKLNMKTVD